MKQVNLYDNVENTYTKGPMYCVMFTIEEERVTHKYPLVSLFRVTEDYNKSKQ